MLVGGLGVRLSLLRLLDSFLPGEFPLDELASPPLQIKIMLESNPLKSRILVRYIYIYIYTYIHMCVYIYIYIHTYNDNNHNNDNTTNTNNNGQTL